MKVVRYFIFCLLNSVRQTHRAQMRMTWTIDLLLSSTFLSIAWILFSFILAQTKHIDSHFSDLHGFYAFMHGSYDGNICSYPMRCQNVCIPPRPSSTLHQWFMFRASIPGLIRSSNINLFRFVTFKQL